MGSPFLPRLSYNVILGQLIMLVRQLHETNTFLTLPRQLTEASGTYYCIESKPLLMFPRRRSENPFVSRRGRRMGKLKCHLVIHESTIVSISAFGYW
jgi:hypothetical protein